MACELHSRALLFVLTFLLLLYVFVPLLFNEKYYFRELLSSAVIEVVLDCTGMDSFRYRIRLQCERFHFLVHLFYQGGPRRKVQGYGTCMFILQYFLIFCSLLALVARSVVRRVYGKKIIPSLRWIKGN